MKGLVFHEPGNLEVTEVAERALEPDEVRLCVTYAGVCGTDRRIFAGTKAVKGPRIIGHEFVGFISEVGASVPNWSRGDRVAVYPIITCGTCHACRAGRKNICVNRRTFGYEIDGGFAESCVLVGDAVRGGNLVRLPAGLTDKAAAVAEPFAAALQGMLRANVQPGDDVVILGAGPIGTAHTMLSRLMGARRVVVSEPDPNRRRMVQARGADAAIDPKAGSLLELVHGVLDGDGASVVLIDAGVPRLVPDALSALRKGGRCVIFAGMPPDVRVEVDPNLIHYGEVDLVGSSGSTPELLGQVLSWAAQGRLDIASLVSTILPLDGWRSAFTEAEDLGGLKVLFALNVEPHP